MAGVGGLFFLRHRKGSAMTRRRTLYLPALLVAAVLVACMVAVLAVSKKATFSGQNGKIAYVDYSGVLYTINANGSAKTKVTNTWAGGIPLDYSPDGKKIAYTGGGGFNPEIYTVNVGGGVSLKLLRVAILPGGSSVVAAPPNISTRVRGRIVLRTSP